MAKKKLKSIVDLEKDAKDLEYRRKNMERKASQGDLEETKMDQEHGVVQKGGPIDKKKIQKGLKKANQHLKGPDWWTGGSSGKSQAGYNESSNIESWWKTRERDAKMEDKMPGQEYRIQMSKVKTKDKSVRKAIGNVYDNKPVDKKIAGHPEVEKAKKYMGEMARAALLNKVVKQSMDYTPEKIELKSFSDFDIQEVAGDRGRPKKGHGTDSEGHIIMQLRSAQDLKGNKDIKFRTHSSKVHPKHIGKILKAHDHPSMKPIHKRKLRVAISKSHNHLKRVADQIKD
tara:strand:+ start:2537 stop:3394 length:858 start_codon:yes stop_codon:yes gene_type:complete